MGFLQEENSDSNRVFWSSESFQGADYHDRSRNLTWAEKSNYKEGADGYIRKR